MRVWVLPLLAAYAGAAVLDGIRGVLLLAGIGVSGTTVMFGADFLAEWQRGRAERRAVYARWAQWELEQELRRAGWRRRHGA